MSTVIPVAKLAVNVLAGIGVTKVVKDIITNNTNVVTTADAVKVWSGGLVIGAIIMDSATKHVNDRMNELVAWNENRKAEDIPEDTPEDTTE